MIELRNVTKFFSQTAVLSDLSFSVPDGETFALLGLSGSGKTTALKLVCGLHQPDGGEVLVQNIPVVDERMAEVRSQLGYVIQDGGLFPHLTAYQNVWLVGREAGWSDERIRARVEELAALAKLPMKFLDSYPRQLSGGQRQRIGILRALLRDPPVLLLDEPLGALDPITRSELQHELKDLFQRLRKTVLLVTHDLYEAGYLADRILLLNGGRILQQGSLQDLVRNPADEFVHRFVQSQRHEGGEG
jgi:osmoprotectant transport system ATP-binding protein